ncbi:MAG: DUF547 domain-containing protein [Crocinitomix sp.]|nr:DUF547 domain-containing protein [Crocinitomix sp.]
MQKPINILTTILFIGIVFSSTAQEHLKHETWTALLTMYVDVEEHANYAGFKEDETALDAYLTVLSENHPQDSWEKDDILAFWINTYNAFTVKLIVKNYPVKSIKELGGSIYKVNTPWDIKFIKIGDLEYDLNNIEHGIIRKQFEEPRIHFAVNCASISCLRLRNEAFFGSEIDAQLDDQARYFINNPVKNKITKKCAELSKIFTWFKCYFTSNGVSVTDFINKYSEVKITKKTKTKSLDYDWLLNE